MFQDILRESWVYQEIEVDLGTSQSS